MENDSESNFKLEKSEDSPHKTYTDGWVIEDGKKIKKYFSYRSNWKYFWEPCLNQICKIEELRYKLKKKSDQKYKLLFLKLKEMVKTQPFNSQYGEKVWLAHANPYINKKHEDGAVENWRLYHFSKDFDGIHYSFEWVKKPKNTFNLKLGQSFFEIDNYHYRNKRYAQINGLLDDAIINYIRNKFPDQKTYSKKIYELSINGRIYRYISTTNGRHYPNINQICGPDDPFVKRTIAI